VSDYLDQLARRIQQPEFVVQPRPVSRFESPRHATLVVPEPPVPEKLDELESPSIVVAPTATRAGQPAPQTNGRSHNASETTDPLSTTRPIQESHKPYPGPLASVPPLMSQTIPTAAPPQPVHEVADPALPGHSAEQRERIADSAVEPVQPSIRIDKTADHADTASSTLPGRQQLTSLAEPVVRGEREPTPPLAGSSRSTEITDRASLHPSRRPEFPALQEPVVRAAREQISQFVNIANAAEKLVSPLGLRTTDHGQTAVENAPAAAEPLLGRQTALMPQSGFALTPEREVLTPRVEPTAPPLRVERSADAPTIQVTIGRVEIRATVEATPARKPPAKAPVMSLDEYLRQRNGGRG